MPERTMLVAAKNTAMRSRVFIRRRQIKEELDRPPAVHIEMISFLRSGTQVGISHSGGRKIPPETGPDHAGRLPYIGGGDTAQRRVLVQLRNSRALGDGLE